MHPTGQNPIPEGMFLGEMSNEEPDYRIVAYYSGGPKQYCLKMVSREDQSVKYTLKLRGITLDYKTSKAISYETFKQQVLNYGQIDPIFVDVTRFELSRNGNIHTVFGQKKYRSVSGKGIIDERWDVLPFGYEPIQGAAFRISNLL